MKINLTRNDLLLLLIVLGLGILITLFNFVQSNSLFLKPEFLSEFVFKVLIGVSLVFAFAFVLSKRNMIIPVDKKTDKLTVISKFDDISLNPFEIQWYNTGGDSHVEYLSESVVFRGDASLKPVYFFTGGKEWIENPPTKSQSVKIKGGIPFNLNIQLNSNVNFTFYTFTYDGTRQTSSHKINYRKDSGSIDIRFKAPENAVSLRIAFRFSGKYEAEVKKILLEDIRSKMELFEEFKAPDVSPAREMKIATLLDEFSHECLKYEAHLIPLGKKNWKKLIRKHKPRLLLAESAWRANSFIYGDEWHHCFDRYEENKKKGLEQLLMYCRENGIKTVFWNKEDPPNYKHFIDVAKQFDYVFTSDSNCIPDYKRDLGHDKIWALPFAAQPMIHNPVGSSRVKDICFAGTWYNKKHFERTEDLQNLLDAALGYKLDIYDRNYFFTDNENYKFPEIYRQNIRGNLNYSEMLTAYRKYRLFLNVNSVKDSPTMFSRRVFEATACGALVVSNPSKGMATLLGKSVVIANSLDEADSEIEFYINNPAERDAKAHIASRNIFREHTYSHRIDFMLDKIGYDYPKIETSKIDLFAEVENLQQLKKVVQFKDSQLVQIETIFIKCDNDELLPNLDSLQSRFDIQMYDNFDDAFRNIIETNPTNLLALINPEDKYGGHYLNDLKNALNFSNAQIVGKSKYFYHDGEKLFETRSGKNHDYDEWLNTNTLLCKKSVIKDIEFVNGQISFSKVFSRNKFGNGIYSSDIFNYLKSDTNIKSKNSDSRDIVESRFDSGKIFI